MDSKVLFGIDSFLEKWAKYYNKRIGLVCNSASVTSEGIHSRIALKDAGFNIVKLFAPEHGFSAKGDDGAYIDHQEDEVTGIPIISLYGDRVSPSKDDLTDIDLMIIDLPDIGARFYTYLWTMTYVMESCTQYKKPVILLDRPNPQAFNLDLAEGPNLHPSCSSFIGRWNIPITHHCTFGELAQYFHQHYFPSLDLTIIPLQNWNRQTNTGYTFFPTSPAIQKRETIYTYPGACLFEGLNIHEGRGTDYPFAQFGAPWIDAARLENALMDHSENVSLQKVQYPSEIGIYLGETCHGLRIFPKQPQKFLSVQFFIHIIQLIDKLFPNKLTERNYYTNANPSGSRHLDKLLGIPHAFDFIRHNPIDTLSETKNWKENMLPFLLY